MRTPNTAQTTALALAAFVTLTLLGGIDSLAYEQHAAVQLARAKAVSTDVAKATPQPAKRG